MDLVTSDKIENWCLFCCYQMDMAGYAAVGDSFQSTLIQKQYLIFLDWDKNKKCFANGFQLQRRVSHEEFNVYGRQWNT